MLRLMVGAFTLLQFACVHVAPAQTFNLRSDPHALGYGEVAFSVENNEVGEYIVIAGTPYDDGQYFVSSVVTAIRVSQAGLVQGVDMALEFPYATYAGWSNSTHKRSDGGFVVGGGNFRTDSLDNWIQRPVLYFFDAQGNYEQHIPLGPDNQSWIVAKRNRPPMAAM